VSELRIISVLGDEWKIKLYFVWFGYHLLSRRNMKRRTWNMKRRTLYGLVIIYYQEGNHKFNIIKPCILQVSDSDKIMRFCFLGNR
jgi:hypothetical protein